MALGCTVQELEDRLSSRELTEWIAYSELEPFGAEWDNWRAGMLASVIANVNRGKGQQALKATEFMPGKREKRQDWRQIRAAFQMAFGKSA